MKKKELAALIAGMKDDEEVFILAPGEAPGEHERVTHGYVISDVCDSDAEVESGVYLVSGSS